MRFDLTDLRLFLNIAEAGSITAGADRSGLALASASARIRGMEETLGVALLERSPRGVSPTPAGRALRRHATLMLGQLEHMRGDLRAYARGLKGHVRLLANTSAANESLPRPISRFLAARPELDIDLEVRPSHVIVEAIAGGQADVGIAADTTALGGLETYPFYRRPAPHRRHALPADDGNRRRAADGRVDGAAPADMRPPPRRAARSGARSRRAPALGRGRERRGRERRGQRLIGAKLVGSISLLSCSIRAPSLALSWV
jgi:DNA-binding transcriptional LysR family regulator